jgi:hypothetical protein
MLFRHLAGILIFFFWYPHPNMPHGESTEHYTVRAYTLQHIEATRTLCSAIFLQPRAPKKISISSPNLKLKIQPCNLHILKNTTFKKKPQIGDHALTRNMALLNMLNLKQER